MGQTPKWTPLAISLVDWDVMRTIALIILCGGLGNASAQAQAPRPDETVACEGLEGLSKAVVRNLGGNVRCRLERRDVTCVPGTTLTVDAKGDIDLCLSPDKRPLTHPYCAARNPGIYRQRIIQRGRFVVDLPDGRSEVRLLDLPFSVTGRKENLAQTQPIEQAGPDACVYIQKRVLYHPYPRGSRLEPAPNATATQP